MRSQVHLIHSSLPCPTEILEEIRQETSRDPLLQKIVQVLHEGWPLSKKLCQMI